MLVQIQKRKWNWHGHTLRRGNERIVKQALVDKEEEYLEKEMDAAGFRHN